MATATKRRSGKDATDRVLEAAAEHTRQLAQVLDPPASPLPVDGAFARIPIGQLEPSPLNPRKHFDVRELAELGQQLKEMGVLTELMVRESPAQPVRGKTKYEIVDGERRYRAATLAEIAELPCKIVSLTDVQALEVMLVSQFQRKQLNPIEEAMGFKALLDPASPTHEAGLTQAQLAERLKCTQGHIANRIRLLELPDKWQKLVIEGTLPASHAREALPWLKHKAIAKQLDDDLGQILRQDEGAPSLLEWKDMIDSAVRRHSCELDGDEYEYDSGKRYKWKVDLTDELREKLQVVDVEDYNGKLKPRAFNEKLARELIASVKADAKGKQAKAADKKESKKAAADKKRPPTKAELKEREEQYQRRLFAWKVDWLRLLCVKHLNELQGHSDPRSEHVIRLLLYFAVNHLAPYHVQPAHSLARALGVKVKDTWYGVRSDDIWAALTKGTHDSLCTAAAEFVRLLLWGDAPRPAGARVESDGEGGPRDAIHPDQVLHLAEVLQIDLAKEWQANRAGESMTERYYNLHTRDQLLAIAKSTWKLPYTDKMKRSDIVKDLLGMSAHETGKLPAEIEKAKG